MSDSDPSAAPAAVPPELAATYAAATRYGFLERAGGRLRCACWDTPRTARGTVVLMTGHSEFIEKYATEVVGELLARDYAVASMDWRGQGLSDRPLADRAKSHIDDFATYVADFQLFLERLVVPQAPRPVLALCHSMGAHIVLRALAEHGAGPFSAGMFVAPMTGLKREALLRAMLRLVPVRVRLEEQYLAGTGAAHGQAFVGNVLTHDERRFRFKQQWFAADPRLAIGGPTLGWCRQAARSLALLRSPGFLERIELPALVLSAAEDMLVDSATHAPVADRLRRGAFLSIAGSRHEILMETDDIRARFWEAFDHMAKGVTAPALSP
ncbi:MAG: alpha/beta hydrolase [Alphaproteobacteria bacterium]|nr:alpha/beta hydrolase [Alphaproteobacteria bacterium]MBV8410701.1 alpha/beta hydrolase [Alphaproteobacteria bacterium]